MDQHRHNSDDQNYGKQNLNHHNNHKHHRQPAPIQYGTNQHSRSQKVQSPSSNQYFFQSPSHQHQYYNPHNNHSSQHSFSFDNGHNTHNAHNGHNGHDNSLKQQMGQSSPNIFANSNNHRTIHHTQRRSTEIYQNHNRNSQPSKQYGRLIAANSNNTPQTQLKQQQQPPKLQQSRTPQVSSQPYNRHHYVVNEAQNSNVYGTRSRPNSTPPQNYNVLYSPQQQSQQPPMKMMDMQTRGRSKTYSPMYAPQIVHEKIQQQPIPSHPHKTHNKHQHNHHHPHHRQRQQHQTPPAAQTPNSHHPTSHHQIAAIQQQLRMTSSSERQLHHHHHHHHNNNGYPSNYAPSPPVSPQVLPAQAQQFKNFVVPTSPQIVPNGHHHPHSPNPSQQQLPSHNPLVLHSMSEQNVIYHNNMNHNHKHKHNHNHNHSHNHNGGGYHQYHHTQFTSTNHYAISQPTTSSHSYSQSHYQHPQHPQQPQPSPYKPHSRKKRERFHSSPEPSPEIHPMPTPIGMPQIETTTTNNGSFYNFINNGTPSSSGSSAEHDFNQLASLRASSSSNHNKKRSSDKQRHSGNKHKGLQQQSRSKRSKNHKRSPRAREQQQSGGNSKNRRRKKKKDRKRQAIWGHRKQETNKYFKKTSSHQRLLKDKQIIYKKSDSTKRFLKKRIQKELLFEKLPESMIKRMVQKMYRIDIAPNQIVVSAGDPADAYFVIEKGVLEIWQSETINPENNNPDDDGSDGNHSPKLTATLSSGDTFGDNALLYATTHQFTYRAQSSPEMNLMQSSGNLSSFIGCRCWALDEETFENIRKKQAASRLESLSKRVKFLKSIAMFKDMLNPDLQEVSEAMRSLTFRKRDKIVCEGDSPTHFFIIYRGECHATKKDIKEENGEYKILKSYTSGDCFGELGIMKNQSRAATITVTSDQLIAYALPKLEFKALLDYNEVAKTMNNKINQYTQIPNQYENRVHCELDEFKEIGCLGVGAFGRVTLVENPQDKQVYALKKVRKNRVVETSQQEHIINEKRIMAALDSPFCIRLFATFKDKLNVYFLLEPVMGGELFSLLRHEKKLKQRTAMFYCACVVLAFDYLHSKLNVIYRDLKPENLLISNNGYCKLVDFGFAKKRNNTCTLCGTPQYLAPEVIQNLTHGFAVDWWSVGILIYEMIFGFPPFEGDKHMKMYEKILTAPVEFPQTPKVRAYTKDIITSLLRKQAHKRLGAGTKGAETVKKKQFFKHIDWNKMYKQEIDPPWKPRINGTHDLSAFDRFPDTSPENEQLVDDPDGQLFKWCEEF